MKTATTVTTATMVLALILGLTACGGPEEPPAEETTPATPTARPGGKADTVLPDPSDVSAALAATAKVRSLARCSVIDIRRAEAFSGVDFEVALTSGIQLRAPRPGGPKFSHWATVKEPSWWRSDREVRLDYEFPAGTYTVGSGIFERTATRWTYVRLMLKFEDGDPDKLVDVVYTEWSWDSHTILPYHVVYEHSCRQGVTSSG